MKYLRILLLLLPLSLALDGLAQNPPAAPSEWTTKSPDGKQELIVKLEAGRLTYRIDRLDGKKRIAVLAPSPLGLRTDIASFADNLAAKPAGDPAEVNETYAMLTGKQLQLRDHHNAWTLAVTNASGAGLRIQFRVYDDGVAFRYQLPELPSAGTRVTAELTGFKLPSAGKTWMQAYQEIAPWAPAYEDYYTNGEPVGANAPRPQGWAFPGLFETDGGWLLLTESDLDGNSFGAHLAAEVKDRTYVIRLPLPEDGRGQGAVEASVNAPWSGAWRILVTGPTLATIAESNLVHHVSRAPEKRDWSWVKPGRSTWSWWSQHDSPRNFNALKSFIDLAADWGWEYSLVDANWNIMEHGTVEQLADYAKQKKVGLLLWYNSGGDHNEITEQPRDRLVDRKVRRAEFAKLEKMGIKGVKVDFFQSDKQWMIQHYLGILEDAADYHLLVDFHGCTIPRGWQRTHPNLMSMEAVRGAETYSCCEDYGPAAVWQNTILPFTRNVIGSMDYTPVTFTNQKIPHQTTSAHELALSTLFESGIQHYADAVEGYRQLPKYAQDWLRDAPVAWDETRFVDGYPGQLAVLARRKGNVWYVAGIEGARKARDLSLALPFLTAKGYKVELITDEADGKTLAQAQSTLAPGGKLKVSVRPAGGFAARLTPQ